MLDRHEAHDDRNIGQDAKHRDAASTQNTERTMADREVPLGGMAAAGDDSMIALHQWLDGDLPEADARRADAKQVALWNVIEEETARRRRMVTPSHVAANIMNALPAADVSKRLATHVSADTAMAPTAQRAGLSMMAVAAIGATLFALGIFLGKTL